MSKVGHSRQVGLPTAVGSDDGSGYEGGGYVRPPLPEYCSTLYHDSSNNGAMSGRGAVAGGAGYPMMVWSGRSHL